MAQQHPDRSADEYAALREQQTDLEEVLAESRRSAALLKAERGERERLAVKLDEAPPEYRDWLGELILQSVRAPLVNSWVRQALGAGVPYQQAVAEGWAHPDQDGLSWHDPAGVFLSLLDQHGLEVAACYFVDFEDQLPNPAAPVGPGQDPIGPPVAEGWLPLLLVGLESPDESVVARVVKWLPTYAPPERSVPLLRRLLRESPHAPVRWWAAIHLSMLAPDTSGLIAELSGAMATAWKAWGVRKWLTGSPPESGQWEAAEALMRLGPGIWSALPHEAAAGLLAALVHPAHDVRAWAADGLGRLGVVSIEILLQLLVLTEDLDGDPALARDVLRQLTDLLRTGKATIFRSSPEEGFWLTLWLQPRDEVCRLAFADWLEENGHPERARFVRLDTELHRLSAGDPALEPLQDQWHEASRECLINWTEDPRWLERWQQVTHRHPDDLTAG